MRAVFKQLTMLLCLLCTTGGAHAGLKEGVAAFEAKDYPAALKEFEPLAKQGQAEAQHYLGSMYGSGLGVAKDEQQALVWYQKAAEQGHIDTQIFLGVIYDHGGMGVAQDEQQAVMWLRKAAAQGDINGQEKLELLLERLKKRGITVHPLRKADEQEQTPTTSAEESLLLQAQQQISGGDRMAAFKLFARVFGESASTGTRNKALQGLALVYPALKPPPGLPEDARRYLVQAEGYVEEKNYTKALDLIEQALRTAPWWANAYFDKALIHAERREYALATLSMQRFMTLAPGSEKAREAQDKIYKWEPRLKSGR